MKALLKDGAKFGQDMGYHTWKGGNVIFDVHDFNDDRRKLTAPGYGILEEGKYGNGALFVRSIDLIEIDDTVETPCCCPHHGGFECDYYDFKKGCSYGEAK